VNSRPRRGQSFRVEFLTVAKDDAGRVDKDVKPFLAIRSSVTDRGGRVTSSSGFPAQETRGLFDLGMSSACDAYIAPSRERFRKRGQCH
jgi:hypothetical protein